MERIKQKEDNPICIGQLGDGVFIAEVYGENKLSHIIPIEKSSIPALIAALQKYAE